MEFLCRICNKFWVRGYGFISKTDNCFTLVFHVLEKQVAIKMCTFPYVKKNEIYGFSRDICYFQFSPEII